MLCKLLILPLAIILCLAKGEALASNSATGHGGLEAQMKAALLKADAQVDYVTIAADGIAGKTVIYLSHEEYTKTRDWPAIVKNTAMLARIAFSFDGVQSLTLIDRYPNVSTEQENEPLTYLRFYWERHRLPESPPKASDEAWFAASRMEIHDRPLGAKLCDYYRTTPQAAPKGTVPAACEQPQEPAFFTSPLPPQAPLWEEAPYQP
jgi:hypothetical protein